MTQLLIRNVDAETITRLKARARRNHRSLESELRLILEEAGDVRVINRMDEVDKIRLLFGNRSFDDSTTLLREDRDR